MREDLINFWRYAFNSGRPTSERQFLTPFWYFVVPFLVVLQFNGVYLSSQTDCLSGVITVGIGFAFTNVYAALIYGILMIPTASLYISRLRTNGRRVIWFFVWTMILPVWGPIIMLWPCLKAPRKRWRYEKLRPKSEYD